MKGRGGETEVEQRQGECRWRKGGSLHPFSPSVWTSSGQRRR